MKLLILSRGWGWGCLGGNWGKVNELAFRTYPFIHLAFEKQKTKKKNNKKKKKKKKKNNNNNKKPDYFIYLIVWNVDIFIYRPLIFIPVHIESSLRCLHTCLEIKKNTIAFQKLNAHLAIILYNGMHYTNSAV